jgi:hypothetical protein
MKTPHQVKGDNPYEEKRTGAMTNGRELDKEAVYEIRVKVTLSQSWSDWFEGFSLTCQHGETSITGPIKDQAALMGLLGKIDHLNLPLLAVNRLESRDEKPEQS